MTSNGKSRLLTVRYISSLVLVPLFLYGCASSSGTTYREFSAKLPPLKPDHGRLVFFGTDIATLSTQFGHFAAYTGPSLAINGVNYDAPRGHNIFFVIDRPAGENRISTDGDHSYNLVIERGSTYFYQMQVQRIPKTGALWEDSHWLKLLKVDPDYANRKIKTMSYKAIKQTTKEG